MGRKSIKETRQKEIILGFYQIAKKEGLDNASIAKTAQHLNINPSLIMHYFQTKEDLIHGLIEFTLDKYLLIFKVSEKVKSNPEKALLEVIDHLFSKKWNTLFDDGVYYSCYALIFQRKIIQEKFHTQLNTLRSNLQIHIENCQKIGKMKNVESAVMADLIFILVDGAYFYLSTIKSKAKYQQQLANYKQQAIRLLQLS